MKVNKPNIIIIVTYTLFAAAVFVVAFLTNKILVLSYVSLGAIIQLMLTEIRAREAEKKFTDLAAEYDNLKKLYGRCLDTQK